MMLFVIVFAEMCVYTVRSVKAVGNSNRTTYYTSYDDVQAVKNAVVNEDKDFYRMEVYNNWTCNDAALYGYNGLSQFSSEINSNVTAMMKYLGLAADPGSNSFRYLVQTPIVNSLLNVKYIIARDTTMNDPFYEGKYQSGTTNIYESEYPLSIGYIVNKSIKEWTPADDTAPFENQIEYIKLALGKEYANGLFTDISTYDESASTCDNATLDGFNEYSAMVTSNGGASTAHLVYNAEKDGPVYIYAKVENADSVSAKVGENGQSVSFENNRGCIVSLGEAKEGDDIYLDINFSEDGAGMINTRLYTMDTEIWNKAYEKLKSEMLNVTEYSDTKIEGTVTAEKDGTLFTSIPYEKGWRAYVDGKRVEVNSINEAFCSIDMTAGQHTVEFKYIPYGFVLGNVVTIMSIGLLIALYYLDKTRNQRKEAIQKIEQANLPIISLNIKENSEEIPEQSKTE